MFEACRIMIAECVVIVVDMLAFAIDNPAPAVIVLISGDRDFAYTVAVLRLRGYEVIVIAPSSAHATLRAQASRLFDWQRDVINVAVDLANPEDIRDMDDGLPLPDRMASPSSTLAELRVSPSTSIASCHAARQSLSASDLDAAVSCSDGRPSLQRHAASQTDVQTRSSSGTRCVQCSRISSSTAPLLPVHGARSQLMDTGVVNLQLDRDATFCEPTTRTDAEISRSASLQPMETLSVPPEKPPVNADVSSIAVFPPTPTVISPSVASPSDGALEILLGKASGQNPLEKGSDMSADDRCSKASRDTMVPPEDCPSSPFPLQSTKAESDETSKNSLNSTLR